MAEAAHPPQSLAPVEPERAEGVGVGELLKRRRRHPRPAPDLLDRGEGRIHRRRSDPGAVIVRKPLHHAQAEAEWEQIPPLAFEGRGTARSAVEGLLRRKRPLHHASHGPPPLQKQGRILGFQRAIPPAGVDADRADLDAMLARVADELGDAVKAHRLGVEQRRAEDFRMIIFHPGRGVGDPGEARGVAFGEAVAAEALDLPEGALGEVRAIAAARSSRRSSCRGTG